MAELTLEQQQALAKARARRRRTEQTAQQPEPQQGGGFNQAFDTAMEKTIQGAGALREAVTGEKRGRGDLPELSSIPGIPTKAAIGFITTPDLEARKDILRKSVPGVEFASDESQNTIVRLPDGQEAFLNAPGLSMQDFVDLGADVLKFLPAARFAAGGKSVAGRVFRGAAGAGATSVAEDLGAVPLGSEQPVSLGRGGVTAAAGGIAESVAPIAGRIANTFRRTFGRRTQDIIRDGQLTPQARAALTRAGIDPDAISPELAESAIRLSEEGGNVATGIAQSERTNVPLTRGQATGDFGQIAREEALRSRGDQAGDIIRSFDRRQSERMIAVTREIQDELAKEGPRIRSAAEGGGVLAGELRDQSDDLLLQIDEAFKNAEGVSAKLNREGLDRLSNVSDVIREEGIPLDPDLVPATAGALRKISELTSSKQAGTGILGPSGSEITRPEITSRSLDEIDEVRKNLNNFQKAAKNPADLRGVTLIKRRFNQFLDDAFENALFEGDEQALSLLNEARGLRAEFGRRFQERPRRNRSGRLVPDPGGKTVEAILENGPTDEGVVNMIFGRGRLFGGDDAVRSVRAIRQATGDSPVVDRTLKQLGFRRLISNSIVDGEFRPRQFRTALDKAMKDNPTLMRELFTPQELGELMAFSDVAMRTVPPGRATNPSGTAPALTRALGSLGMMLGLQRGGIGFGALGGGTGRSVGRLIERGVATRQAEDAINPKLLLPGRPSNTTISGIISATREGLDGQNEEQQ